MSPFFSGILLMEFDFTDLGMVSPGTHVLCPSWRSQKSLIKRIGFNLARSLHISFFSSLTDFQTKVAGPSSTAGNRGIQSNGTRLIKSSPASDGSGASWAHLSSARPEEGDSEKRSKSKTKDTMAQHFVVLLILSHVPMEP